MKGKAASPTKEMKSGKPSQNSKKELRKAQKHKKLTTPPNTLNVSSPPKIGIIMFLLSTTLLAKSSTNFVSILPPLTMNSSNTNWEKNEMLRMRSKIRMLYKAYK
jgi:hypothetical protein